MTKIKTQLIVTPIGEAAKAAEADSTKDITIKQLEEEFATCKVSKDSAKSK